MNVEKFPLDSKVLRVLQRTTQVESSRCRRLSEYPELLTYTKAGDRSSALQGTTLPGTLKCCI